MRTSKANQKLNCTRRSWRNRRVLLVRVGYISSHSSLSVDSSSMRFSAWSPISAVIKRIASYHIQFISIHLSDSHNHICPGDQSRAKRRKCTSIVHNEGHVDWKAASLRDVDIIGRGLHCWESNCDCKICGWELFWDLIFISIQYLAPLNVVGS